MKFVIAICALATALCTSLTAQEEKPSVKDSYGYVDLGVGPAPIPLPIYGIGYRFQSNEHGFNASLRSSTVVVFTSLKLGLHYFHYFKPDLDKQFYMGIGPSIGGVFQTAGHSYHREQNHLIASPELIVGKSYRSDTGARRFFEASIDFPTFTNRAHRCLNGTWSKTDVLWFPLVSLHYGWGF
jgi:hypothetical protein